MECLQDQVRNGEKNMYETEKFFKYFGKFVTKSLAFFGLLSVLFLSLSMMFPSETEAEPKDIVELLILWLGFFWLLMIGALIGLGVFYFFSKRKVETLI